VFFAHTGAFSAEPNWYLNTFYRREQERGYAALEDIWSPGAVRFSLLAGQSAHFVCSADRIELDAVVEQTHRLGATTAKAVSPAGGLEVIANFPRTVPATSPTAQEQVLADLTRAASQFVVRGGASSSGNAVAESGETTVPAVIGQYPWAPPSGRAAMAGFAGLFLIPARTAEARAFLLSFASKLERGLLPTEFPENGSAPIYLGVDVSLWFANAMWSYLRYAGDELTVSTHLLDPLLRIVEQYRRGTRLGISADDVGLLRSQAPATPTTWMDAKVGDWVITPRQGRAVEVNALWYNTLCIAAELASRFGRGSVADELSGVARTCRSAFNERFWNSQANCCFDVVTDHAGDATMRPNQLLAMSLPFPVLSIDRHAAVLEHVLSDLVTPRGVRTLAPNQHGDCGRYSGNVGNPARAAHAGCAFPWLLGPLVTAYLRVHGRGDGARAEAGRLLQGCIDHLRGDGLGQLPELFDGDAPHLPGGAIASALAVAEVLRAYYEDVLDRAPVPSGSAAPPLHDAGATTVPRPTTRLR
jgi:predicted glycogen debranching enzyme